MMDWDEYRYLLACSRSSSIRAAAKKLEVSHSTVLRKLDRLERRLGARLFNRNTQDFTLTEAGQDVLVGVREVEDSLQSIERMVTGHDNALEGLVKVSIPNLLDTTVLATELGRFKKRFPGIQVKIDLSYTVADLHKREADLAIRFTNAPDHDLVGRKVARSYQAVYATEAYLDAHDPSEALSTAQWIAWGNPQYWLPKTPFPHLGIFGYFDDVAIQVALVKANQGLGFLPCLIADCEPALVRLSPPDFVADLWVLYHSDLRQTTRVRVVRDFLIEFLSRAYPSYLHRDGGH